MYSIYTREAAVTCAVGRRTDSRSYQQNYRGIAYISVVLSCQLVGIFTHPTYSIDRHTAVTFWFVCLSVWLSVCQFVLAVFLHDNYMSRPHRAEALRDDARLPYV